MEALLGAALALPLLTALLSMYQSRPFWLELVNLLGSGITSMVLAVGVFRIFTMGAFHNGLIYVDYLSAVLLLLVAVLSFTATLFSLSYMNRELQHKKINFVRLRRYYGLLNVFVCTMISVLIVENLGLMWVAVEATTLASAFLVAFYFNRSAIEAAWKYVMVCTVGICLALLGNILMYYAQLNAVGEGAPALSWFFLKQHSALLEPSMVKLAFAFLLVGYGTKTGLAPMHTWLPDAHSQAPSPVSGLLSGALLSCALYAILRNLMIVQGAVSGPFLHNLLIAFGLGSILIAIPFILVQSDFKRLLAYSSVEHMGIITLGLGIGSPLAVYGALLHMLNHAVTKSALFYIAGLVTQEYKTKHLMRIRGVISVMPLIGTFFIITVFAITGMPPFSVFISKFTIVWAAFRGGYGLVGWTMLMLLAAVFGGMMFYCLRMALGAVPDHGPAPAVRIGLPATAAIGVSVVVILVNGLYIPAWLNSLLTMAAAEISGGQLL